MNRRDLRFTLPAYYKSAGAISFIRNKMGASGATHITDALSSLFGKAELFSILRYFALFINHSPFPSSSLPLGPFVILSSSPSPSLPFHPPLSLSLSSSSGIRVENKRIRYSVIKRRRNTVRPPHQARVGKTARRTRMRETAGIGCEVCNEN